MNELATRCLVFALISESKHVSYGDVARLAPALEINAGHCALAWNLPRPAVVAIDKYTNLPDVCIPVVFVDSADSPGLLAVHWYDPVRGAPACRVYVEAGSGFNRGANSASEGAGHEICEALVDPPANLWADHPTRPGVQVALESCDPAQDSYLVRSHGTDFQVANFVTPHWFDGRFNDPAQRARLRAAGKGFDHLGTLDEPGQIGPEGYLVLREPDPANPGRWRVWYETGAGAGARLTAHKTAALQHPWSRSRRRGVEVA